METTAAETGDDAPDGAIADEPTAEYGVPEYEAALGKVSKRLLLVTLGVLGLVVFVFAITAVLNARFWVSWFCFGVGVLGGFVSIQQRLKKLSREEVFYMASSWVTVWLVPIFAGLFALVAYLMFLSGLVEGSMFPAFSINDFADPATDDDMRDFFTQTYPASGQDFAKLAVWSFAAGFSERLIPGMLRGVIGTASSSKSSA